MKHILTIALATIALALVATGVLVVAQNARGPEVLFKAAQHAEEVQGDLKAAIEQYKKVAESGDRALAAQALVRMAGCYEKLGDAESRNIFGQVLRDYADQKEAAATARTRLGITQRARMASRQVAVVGIGGVGYGSVSPDGRYFPHTNWQNGDLYLRDLITDADRRVTNVSALQSDGQFAVQSTFSRDGKQLAYGWYNGNRFELRIVSLQDTGIAQPRRLFVNEDVSSIFPDDWSSDGKWLAVQLKRDDKTAQIGLVGVQDGSLRILKSTDWRGATRLMFSPDGNYLAYDLPVSDTANERDVFVLSINGARETAVAAHPSNDVVMGWAPDGTQLLFASDRTGPMGLWEVSFKDGKPIGAPEPIKTEIAGAPLGVTNNGALYFLVHHPSFNSAISSDIQVADFDFANGKFLSRPTAPVQTFLGTNNIPRWSPDGKYLAYASRRPEGPGSPGTNIIAIRAADSGQVRELRPALRLYPAHFVWSADGLSLFTQATDMKGRQGIYRIDVRTGESSPIATSTSTRGQFRSPLASPDGKKVYYLAAPSVRNTVEAPVIEHDLATGSEKTIVHQSDMERLCQVTQIFFVVVL